MSTIGKNAADIIKRITQSNHSPTATDRSSVEAALQRHFEAVGLAMPPIRWLDGAVELFLGEAQPEQPRRRVDADWLVAITMASKSARRAALAALRNTKEYDENIAGWKQRQWSAMGEIWSLGATARAACDASWRAARRARAAAFAEPDPSGVNGRAVAHVARPFVRHTIDGVAETVAWANSLPLIDAAVAEPMTGIWLPMVDAWIAGLLLYSVRPQEILCVPRPVLSIVGNRLHSGDGPAVAWPNGECYWFWRGVEVTRGTIEFPERLTPVDIREQTNQESRRIMIERMGAKHFLRAAGAILIQTDAFGRLWHVQWSNNETFAMVEVENGTAELDGSRRRYFLRVPPTASTAREAIAWTYGLTEDQYDVVVRT
jgi:hypothetical protein